MLTSGISIFVRYVIVSIREDSNEVKVSKSGKVKPKKAIIVWVIIERISESVFCSYRISHSDFL